MSSQDFLICAQHMFLGFPYIVLGFSYMFVGFSNHFVGFSYMFLYVSCMFLHFSCTVLYFHICCLIRSQAFLVTIRQRLFVFAQVSLVLPNVVSDVSSTFLYASYTFPYVFLRFHIICSYIVSHSFIHVIISYNFNTVSHMCLIRFMHCSCSFKCFRICFIFVVICCPSSYTVYPISFLYVSYMFIHFLQFRT